MNYQCSPSLRVFIERSIILLISVTLELVPIDQLTTKTSNQSIIGDKYAFPARIENSVITEIHLKIGASA